MESQDIPSVPCSAPTDPGISVDGEARAVKARASRALSQGIPPDLPAYAIEVVDANSLTKVIFLLCTTAIKAVTTGKSVTAANKRLAVACTTEVMRAAEAFKRFAAGPLAPFASTSVASAPNEAMEAMDMATEDCAEAPAIVADSFTSTNGPGGAVTGTREMSPVVVATSFTPAAMDNLKRELASCVRDEFNKIKTALSRDARRAAARDLHLEAPPSPPASQQAPSYAQMVRQQQLAPRRVDVSAPSPPVTRPALLVTSKAPTRTRQEAIEAFRSSISFRECDYAPTRIQPVSNNKLRVEFDTTQQRDDTLARLSDSEKVTAEPARRRRPMFIVKGVIKETPSEELVNILKRQNPALGGSEADFSLKFVRRNRNPRLYNAVFLAAPEVWRGAVGLERLYVDHQRVHVENFSPFMQCFACLQFGHGQRHCPNPDKKCEYCAENAHGDTECPLRAKRGTPRCLNCVQRNTKFNRRESTDHSATSNKCPVVQLIKNRVNQQVDFGN